MIHFASLDVAIGALLRQRCAWCGEILLDYNLHLVGVPKGQDPTPATWPIGSLVDVNGAVSSLVEHADGDPLPQGTCADVELVVSDPRPSL